MIDLRQGDCLKVLKEIPDNSVDSIVTDPPYGLKFMNKKWDVDVPSVEVWQEAIRVLKPGGHLISFGGTRTYHRMAVAIEDAGFEIRDMVSWIYGSGFPKSLNIGKAINKIDGVEFEEKPASGVGFMNAEGEGGYNVTKNQLIQKGESSERAKQWEGWGTALKPAQEPCVLARKPLSEKTVAENVLKWGTGGLNIDGSRVEANDDNYEKNTNRDNVKGHWGNSKGDAKVEANPLGRFPANIIHDGSDEVLEVFPETKSGVFKKRKTAGIWSESDIDQEVTGETGGSQGSAARFFYVAKSSKRERTANGTITNGHPTIKPIALMEYMIKLITPPKGTVLDPYMGSGSTGIAAKKLGHNFIGIEMEPEYIEIAKARIGSVDRTLFDNLI